MNIEEFQYLMRTRIYEKQEFWTDLKNVTADFLHALHKYVEVFSEHQISEEEYISKILKQTSFPEKIEDLNIYHTVEKHTRNILPQLLLNEYEQRYKQTPHFLSYSFYLKMLSVVPTTVELKSIIPIHPSLLHAINYKIEQIFHVTTLPKESYLKEQHTLPILEKRHFERLYHTATFLWTSNLSEMHKTLSEVESDVVLTSYNSIDKQIEHITEQAFHDIIATFLFGQDDFLKTDEGMQSFVRHNEKMMYALKIYTNEINRMVHVYSQQKDTLLVQATERIKKSIYNIYGAILYAV